MKWRVINSGRGGAAENMAIDEAIMQNIISGKSLPTIRFYDWEPATVSCGYNQALASEVDLELVKSLGWDFVRRPTGGRTVLHDQEVTYAVIAPIAGSLAGNVTASYSEISRVLARGLSLLGVEVELEKGVLSSSDQRHSINPCFASSSRFELKYEQQKIVGSAQVRRDGVLLQHGSILLNHNQRRLAYILPGLNNEKRERMADFLAKKTIAVNEILPAKVSFDDAVSAFLLGFLQIWQDDVFMNDADISSEERKKAQKLISTKYLTAEWSKRN